MRMTPDPEESVRCTTSGCNCVCFKPGSVQLRSCDYCGHGWVPHALAKLQLQAQPPSSCGPVEVALPGLVFDLSSLVLYGAQAVPVRLKILLDRLYSILSPEQVGHILHTLGWSLGDYVRGYMLQHPSGKVLDRWLMATPEEELLVLKQFLRFGETRPIVELMTLQCLAAVNHLSELELSSAPKSFQSNVAAMFERIGRTPGVFRNARGDSRLVYGYKKNSLTDHKDTVHHFENVPEGPSLLLPFHFPSSALHCLAPPTKELAPPSKLTQCLRKLSGTKLPERQEGGVREEENDPVLLKSKVEQGLKLKADPDKPNTTRSVWHQEPRFLNDQELDLHRCMAKQENTSSFPPSLSSSPFPTSSSLPQPISSSSSSPPKIPQKYHGSSSFPFKSLPSFSSSFLCPLPNSSFPSSLPPRLPPSPSSLCPLPSSLCSLPSLSPAGGRKGRVCCGVCGKSFYDKGTLKIHYNAVHLKIKHRCTVAGCTIVFSSLRSRNRHSANPNPRLHTGAGRDAHAHRTLHADTQIRRDVHDTHARTGREKDIGDTVWQQDEDAHTLTNGYTNPRHADSLSPHPLHRTLNQDTNQNCTSSDGSDLHTPPPPPPPPPFSLVSPPSLVSLVFPEHQHLHTNRSAPVPLPGHAPVSVLMASCDSRPASRDHDVAEGKREEARAASPPTNRQQRRWGSGDPLPKKKPRKSSTPVKIAREKVEEEERRGRGGVLNVDEDEVKPESDWFESMHY